MRDPLYKLLLFMMFFVPCFCTFGHKSDDFTGHIVKLGENVYRISLRYNISVDSIRQWNNLNKDYKVIAGQRLITTGGKYALNSSHPAPEIPMVEPADSSVTLKATGVPDSLLFPEVNTFVPAYSEPAHQSSRSSFLDTVQFYFNKSNILFKIILVLNFIFILSVLLLSVVIIIRRILNGIDRLKTEECQDRYRDYIADWLYTEHRGRVPDALKNELKDRVYRAAFTSELLLLHTNITGESADRLVELFHSAGLKQYSIRKAHSSFWHVKAKGFRELAQMKIKDENLLISRYLNSKNDILRIEAQLAWIQLNPDDPLSFNDDPNIQLTEWGQLNTLVSLKKIETIPNFGRWLTSSNKSVVRFSLKMIGIFKKFDLVELVTKRLQDADQDIRLEAIKALGKMAVTSPIYELIQVFSDENITNKSEIIKSLIMISDLQSIPFFEGVLLDEKDYHLRILAAKGLVSLDAIGEERLDRLFADADPVLKKIITHAKDKRI